MTIHTMEFGYYALSPREYQGMLIPVCRGGRHGQHARAAAL